MRSWTFSNSTRELIYFLEISIFQTFFILIFFFFQNEENLWISKENIFMINSMDKRPPWEANSCPASQEITSLLRNRKEDSLQCSQKPATGLIQSQTNADHTLPPIQFSIILPSLPGFSKMSIPLGSAICLKKIGSGTHRVTQNSVRGVSFFRNCTKSND
jgi:hypothetical protein